MRDAGRGGLTAEPFVIRPVPVADTLRIRDAVLSPGHPGRPVTAPYDHAPGSSHLGLFDGSVLVGCLSAERVPFRGSDPLASYRFHSMAIDPGYQGRGLGSRLLRALLHQLRDQGAGLIWATARPSAVDFYRRFGMTVLDDVGVVPGTGMQVHYVLAQGDALDRLH